MDPFAVWTQVSRSERFLLALAFLKGKSLSLKIENIKKKTS